MNGDPVQFSGADFSYGVGNTVKEAESRLVRHKARRQAQGGLQRGELASIRIQLADPLLR